MEVRGTTRPPQRSSARASNRPVASAAGTVVNEERNVTLSLQEGSAIRTQDASSVPSRSAEMYAPGARLSADDEFSLVGLDTDAPEVCFGSVDDV
jgi:hypothetical protein